MSRQFLTPAGYLNTTTSRQYAVSGAYINEIGQAVELVADSTAYNINGTAAILAKGYMVTASAGTYLVTGQAATLTIGRMLSSESGGYSLVGQTAGLLVGRMVAAEVGSYALFGQPAGLLGGKLLEANGGGYTVVGADAGLEFDSGSDKELGQFGLPWFGQVFSRSF